MQSLRDTFRLLARYNGWANLRLYEAAAALTPTQRNAQAGVFFHSMTGTLNHILVADRIWLARFTGSSGAPTRLDAILFARFAELRAARIAEDARIAAYVESLTETDLAGTFTYAPISEPTKSVTQALAPPLLHMFNHQTHHRGQAHAILTRLTGDAPTFDMIYFQRET